VEKDSSVDNTSPTAPTIAKKTRKKRVPADTPVTPVASTHHATPPELPSIVGSGAPIATETTTSIAAVTAALLPPRSQLCNAQVPAPSAQVASKRTSGDIHNTGASLPVPVSVTDAGTAWRNRKSQLPASGQSVDDMISILERHRQKKPTESVSKPVEIEGDEDDNSMDENEIVLDAESSSHDDTSDDSNPFEDKLEEELSGNENDELVDDDDAEDDAEGSEEEEAPEPLPVKAAKKGKAKSTKEPTSKHKTPIVDAGVSGKVQKKKAVASAGVTKRVPNAKSSRSSSAVKAGSFYAAPKGKPTAQASNATRSRSAKN